jgi:hypothetical protein
MILIAMIVYLLITIVYMGSYDVVNIIHAIDIWMFMLLILGGFY